MLLCYVIPFTLYTPLTPSHRKKTISPSLEDYLKACITEEEEGVQEMGYNKRDKTCQKLVENIKKEKIMKSSDLLLVQP